MTNLKKLVAFNMKEQRRILGISQAALAERVNTSTNYIAMIEMERKTPSLPMLERIAEALQIDSQELFSIQKVNPASLRNLHKIVLLDIEKAVNGVITEKLNEVENAKEFKDKAVETK